LRARYAQVYGEENRSRNKPYLIRRILWKLQADAYGGLSERLRQRARELLDESAVRTRFPRLAPIAAAPACVASVPLKPAKDPRLPPVGTLLRREFRGREIVVEVAPEGFLWEGRTYRTLSSIAREVTGTTWNGFVFFKLEEGAA
jgi:hypothetical protein